MNPIRVTIVGAGVSGLACAHRLLALSKEKNLPLDLKILDAGAKPGGTLSSLEKDGFLLEEGPDCFITDKPSALELAKELGLEQDLIRTNQDIKRSFILKGNHLHPIPEGFYLLAPSRLTPLMTTSLLSPLGKFRAALEVFIPVRRDPQDESVGAFVRRRLGKEVLEALAQPLVGGVYNADPNDLSLNACMPRFKEMEMRHGSLLRGLAARKLDSQSQVSGARYSLFVSLKKGMESLAQALVSRLPTGSLQLQSPAQAITPKGDGVWKITSNGKAWDADKVVLALQPLRMLELIGELDKEWGKLLGGIPAHDSATLNLGFDRTDITHPLDGFGFVVPAREKKLILGCTFASQKFEGRAPEGKVLLRVFLGREAMTSLKSQGATAILERVLAELTPILGLKGKPLFHHLASYPSAMSYYRPGHLSQAARLEQKAAETPGLFLAGNGFKGVGIPDCVSSGLAAAEKIFAGLEKGSDR